MKSRPAPSNRHAKARRVLFRSIAHVGPFLEGALCQFQRPGCAQPGWHLTFKQKGHTRTVYVPMDLVSDVKSWTRPKKHQKKLFRKAPRHSLGLIHGHVANRRAAGRF